MCCPSRAAPSRWCCCNGICSVRVCGLEDGFGSSSSAALDTRNWSSSSSPGSCDRGRVGRSAVLLCAASALTAPRSPSGENNMRRGRSGVQAFPSPCVEVPSSGCLSHIGRGARAGCWSLRPGGGDPELGMHVGRVSVYAPLHQALHTQTEQIVHLRVEAFLSCANCMLQVAHRWFCIRRGASRTN